MIASSLTLSLKGIVADVLKNRCKWWVIEGGEEEYIHLELHSRSIRAREREKEKEKEEKKSAREESIHIVIGWERQTSICFLTNINGVSLYLIDKCLKEKSHLSFSCVLDMIDCFDLSMEFDRQWFTRKNFLRFDQLWLKFDRLSQCGQAHLSFLNTSNHIVFASLWSFSIDRWNKIS